MSSPRPATSGDPGSEHEGFEIRLAWEKVLGEAGWTCLGWPHRVGRPGRDDRPAGDLERGVLRASCPARVGVFGEGLIGPDPDRLRDRGPEEAGSSSPSAWATSSGARATRNRTPARTWPTSRRQRAPRRGRVGDHGPEGLDLTGAVGRLVLRAGPDRQGSRAPQRALLSPRPDGPAGDRAQTDQPAHRDVGVQRGLLRRGADAERTWWSERWTKVGGWHWRPWPSSGGSRCSATRSGSHESSTRSSRSLGTSGRSPTRSCASGWPKRGSRSRSSG